MILYLLLLVVTNTQLITVNKNTLCSCEQLTDQDSCIQMSQICGWSNNQCFSISCLMIDIIDCPLTPNCFWNNDVCLDFTDCQQLSGSSVQNCYTQNVQCSWISGTNCSPMNQVNCNQIYTQTSCTYSGNSLCFWSNGLCMDLEFCSQYTDEYYCSNESLGACYWDQILFECVSNSCATQINCQTILSSPSNLNQFQVCVEQNYGYCVDGSPSDLYQINCLQQTKFTYYWSDKSGKKGGCQPCNYDQLISYVLYMIIIQFIIL